MTMVKFNCTTNMHVWREAILINLCCDISWHQHSFTSIFILHVHASFVWVQSVYTYHCT